MLNDELHYRIIRELDRDPKIPRRALTDSLGVSVGKTNYCVQALEKGQRKVENFCRTRNKLAYASHLTPHGIGGRAKITRRFLELKRHEYETLGAQIADLEAEVGERP